MCAAAPRMLRAQERIVRAMREALATSMRPAVDSTAPRIALVRVPSVAGGLEAASLLREHVKTLRSAGLQCAVGLDDDGDVARLETAAGAGDPLLEAVRALERDEAVLAVGESSALQTSLSGMSIRLAAVSLAGAVKGRPGGALEGLERDAVDPAVDVSYAVFDEERRLATLSGLACPVSCFFRSHAVMFENRLTERRELRQDSDWLDFLSDVANASGLAGGVSGSSMPHNSNAGSALLKPRWMDSPVGRATQELGAAADLFHDAYEAARREGSGVCGRAIHVVVRVDADQVPEEAVKSLWMSSLSPWTPQARLCVVGSHKPSRAVESLLARATALSTDGCKGERLLGAPLRSDSFADLCQELASGSEEPVPAAGDGDFSVVSPPVVLGRTNRQSLNERLDVAFTADSAGVMLGRDWELNPSHLLATWVGAGGRCVGAARDGDVRRPDVFLRRVIADEDEDDRNAQFGLQ